MNKKLLLLGVLPILGVAMIGQQAKEVILPSGIQNKFVADYLHTDTNGYNARAQALNIEIAREGMTLLKNQDDVLPFGSNVKNISVFGKASTDLQLGGGGSGSGRVSSGITKIDLQKSLTDAGFNINPNLTSFYTNSSQSGSGRTNGNSGWTGISQATVGETPVANYTDTLKNSFAQYSDAAVMLIARGGTEGADCKTYDARDNANDPISEKHYLELSKNEGELLDMIEEYFDKVVVLINSGNAFECARLESDPQVSAVIWMGTPGANGAAAIGQFLNGTVNPSGRTVGTWMRDFTLDPVFQNFADNSQTNIDPVTNKEWPQDTMFNPDGSPVKSPGTYSANNGTPQWDNEEKKVVKYGLNGVRPAAYVNYEEGIYMDYRYYETAYADMEKASKGSGDEWYEGEEGVIYPFGYGLSYTTFKQKIVSSNFKGKTIDRASARVEVVVEVENTGDVAGKDVVQLYFKAPYTPGGIEKSYEVLCEFAKTDLLEPGEKQQLRLSFFLQDYASYDFMDANENGFTGYEIEEGKYTLSLNKNAHEVYDAFTFDVPKGGIKYETDRFTGTKVENRFTDRGFYSSLPGPNDVEFTQMSRDDFEETFPTHPTFEDRSLKEGSRVEEYLTHPFHIADLELSDEGEYVPLAAKKTKQDFIDNGWVQVRNGSPLTAQQSTQFSEMVGVPLDDPKWEDFLNEFTYSELLSYISGGSQHNPALSRIGKPSSSDSDGPSQFGTMWWCGAPIVAATYNIDLAFEQGECVGIEGHISNKYGWAGPGVNLHRSPFGGRNFEYYSADPFLTGRMAGRVVAAATDKGIYCYFKHFAVNDQEKGREGIIAYVNEQALRELYLKAFQLVIQEGKSMGIMSAYNRLGLMETGASYPLLVEVLRDEWGFKGSIISDMTHRGNSAFNYRMYENINNRILSLCNQQLDSQNYGPDMNATWDNDAFDGQGAPVYEYQSNTYESYSWWYAVRQCAKGQLYACANSGAMERDLTLSAPGVEFKGVANGYYTGQVDKEINITVELPESLDIGQSFNNKEITDVELSIDPVTPLPEGLTFANGVISGIPVDLSNGYVHVIISLTLDGDNDPTVLGASFELAVMPLIADDALTVPKKGCFGGIATLGIVVTTLVMAGAGLILLKKKEERAE